MCGIAGFLAVGNKSELAAALRAMNDSLVHRGPDGEGFFEQSLDHGRRTIGLSHRRLAIIDVAGGRQPMGNEDGSVHVVFNGEIYNFKELRSDLLSRGHRFCTASDTEVIVHAYEEYGDDCVQKLDGMFAFAIWDSKRERLFLARDRFGKKPLFICDLGHTFLFASEIKALLRFPDVQARLDRSALWDYLLYRYVPGPRTLFERIRKVDPGSIVSLERGRQNCVRYYFPPDKLVRHKTPEYGNFVEEFLSRLDHAVSRRMISDVPFGAFLSGGIDSSAIVALMAHHSQLPIKTFSIGFKEQSCNELEFARMVADRFHTDHHELIVSANDLMEHLPRLVSYRDAPIAEPSDIPIYLLSLEARRVVKMVLTGEGSDEVLAGYPKHRLERIARAYHAVPSSLRRGIIEPLITALPYKFRRIKVAALSIGQEDITERLPRWFGALTRAECKSLLDFDPPPDSSSSVQFEFDPRNSSLRKILYFDQTSWLPDNLLERGDRMTMAASIEARMPFLDTQLVTYVSSLPDNYRLGLLKTKYLLRQAMKQLLPRPIITRKKIGFRVPVDDWFRGSMSGFLQDHLMGPGSHTASYLRKPVISKILVEHIEGRKNHEKLLWSLLNLELWHRQYQVS